jgi:hypothetical protein
MLKSRLWQEVLDLAICWRFFKYQLVLNDTSTRFARDRGYLLKSNERDISKVTDRYLYKSEAQLASEWRLPLDLEKMVRRLDHIMNDLKSLDGPLNQITQMISLHSTLADAKPTVSCRSRKPNLPLIPVITWNTLLSWQQFFSL